MDINVFLLRLLVVFMLAIGFGIHRQRSNKPVGFGTYAFVSTGSCALTMIGIIMLPDAPLTTVGAIITGIGFLGAGALIRTSDKIFGFTSAASIWLFAIVGVIFGVGQYALGLALYGIVIVVITIDTFLEKKGIGSYQRKITITTNRIISVKHMFDGKKMHELTTKIRKLKLLNADVDKVNGRMTLLYWIEGDEETTRKVLNELLEKEWVASCKVE